MSREPLTAAELIQHPQYDTVIWDLKPTSKGKVAVGKDRQSTCQISYETHGNGPIHLVVSHLGSNSLSFNLDHPGLQELSAEF